MTWYRVTIPDYPWADVRSTSLNGALSRGVHSIYYAMPEGERTIYYSDVEYGYVKRKLLIDVLIEVGADNFVVQTAQVPAIEGMSLEDAKKRLGEVRLNLGEVQKRSLFEGVVIKQDPEFAIRVPLGSKVNVVTDVKKASTLIKDLKKLAVELSRYSCTSQVASSQPADDPLQPLK